MRITPPIPPLGRGGGGTWVIYVLNIANNVPDSIGFDPDPSLDKGPFNG